MSAQPQPSPAEPARSAAVMGLATLAGSAKLTQPEEHAVRADPWFASLAPELQHAILARATVRRLRGGVVIAQDSGAADSWYGVAAGAVRLSTSLASGKLVSFQLVEPGAWFGDIPLLDGMGAPCDAETCVDSTLLLLRKDELQQLLARHPDFALALARLNCRRMRQMMGQFADAVSLPLENRLARTLLQLARRFGSRCSGGVVRIGLKMSQQEVADLLGASRQRVNAGLKKLERAGLLRLASGRWQVLDAEGLEALAEAPAG